MMHTVFASDPFAFTSAVAALAQAAAGSELRPFWYIFLAYASAWLVVGGWLFSMARRLSRLEDRLNRDP